ncbi:MAG TPA: VTT domain-containing protein [Gemmatimonadales bacterium]
MGRRADLIEELLATLAAWPPAAIYLIVIAAAVIENFFPPAPADVVITLAAFLSHRGTTSATTVFWVTWVSNVGGAALVYLFARRLGPAFFASRFGRRLISPEAVVAVERNYLRFGIVGLVIARLLPGFRSFTAPFAGIMRLGPVRTLVPIALASAAWYGTLVFLGARLGRNWRLVENILSGLNRTLGFIALLAVLSLVIWLIRRRRRTRTGELQAELTEELKAYPGLGQRALEDPAVAAVAALLLETVSRDESLTPDELEAIERHLRSRWQVSEGGGLPADAAREMLARLEPAARAGLVARLRDLAFGDGALERHEAHVMRRVARLLGMAS